MFKLSIFIEEILVNIEFYEGIYFFYYNYVKINKIIC